MRVHLKYSKNSKNNFEILKDCLKGNINILVIFETELSLVLAHFKLMVSSLRTERTEMKNVGGILLYVKALWY